jgi:hypothetical protein
MELLGMSLLKSVQFATLVLIAVLLMPLGAHVFELPNKLDLSRQAYFTAQRLYSGWAWFGIDEFAALAATLTLAGLQRRNRTAFWLAVFAAACIAAAIAIFLIRTLPANEATRNWTEAPADWEKLRSQWEISHAASAVAVFVGFCSVSLSILLHDAKRSNT